MDRLQALVAQQPDATLRELRDGLGVPLSLMTLCRALRALQLTFKKKSSSGRARPARRCGARETWKAEMIGLDAQRLVFIDETWAKTNLARTHGRSRRGTRLMPSCLTATGKRPPSWRRAVDGLSAPTVVDGAMNGVTFLAWVRQQLVPTLAAGDLVVMDNLSPQSGGCPRTLEAAAKVVYLPPYSPDLNPIELVFSKLKWLLRTPKRAASKDCIRCWEPCSIISHPTNAATTFVTVDTTLH